MNVDLEKSVSEATINNSQIVLHRGALVDKWEDMLLQAREDGFFSKEAIETAPEFEKYVRRNVKWVCAPLGFVEAVKANNFYEVERQIENEQAKVDEFITWPQRFEDAHKTGYFTGLDKTTSNYWELGAVADKLEQCGGGMVDDSNAEETISKEAFDAECEFQELVNSDKIPEAEKTYYNIMNMECIV